MKQSVLDFWLSASSLSGELALIFVILKRRRWTEFPCFAMVISLNLLASCTLYPFMQRSGPMYRDIYWSYYFANILLQGAMIVELARVVLRPTGRWVQDARKQFLTFGAAGAVIALALCYLVAPPAPTLMERLGLRADLFTSLLICELVITVTMASNRLGLGWKNHVMAIGQGLTGWALIAVVIDSIHSYFGTYKFFVDTEAVKTLAYLGALAYWCVRLWHEEPARQPISPELRKYIVALHHRVQYDLGEAER